MDDRIRYTMRKPTDAERRIWPTADHIIEPVPRSSMPEPGALAPRLCP